MRMSAMVARCRRGLKDFLMVVLETALQEKNWVEVTMARARLRDIMREECMGFKIRSRQKENLETEKASLYHVNREAKKSKHRGIASLVMNGIEVEDKDAIQEEVLVFFGNLFHGHHRAGGKNAGTTFQPDFENINKFLEGIGKLSESSKAKIQEEIKLEELELAVKDLKVKKKVRWINS